MWRGGGGSRFNIYKVYIYKTFHFVTELKGKGVIGFGVFTNIGQLSQLLQRKRPTGDFNSTPPPPCTILP